MMVKRKRTTATATATSPSHTPQKAKKRALAKAAEARPSPSPHPHGDIDEDREYKIKAIIGERAGKYHIAWEDDSETGEVYPPTWEPKENANKLAVADWEQTKATKKSASGKPRAQRASSKQQEQRPSPAKPLRVRPRVKPVIESSPTPPPPPPASEPVNTTEVVLEIGESQQSTAVNRTLSEPEGTADEAESLQPLVREPTIQVSDPPSSYHRGSYQLVEPPVEPHSLNSSVVELSAPLPAPSTQVETSTTLVVPDSQSQNPEDSTFRGFSPTQPPQADIECTEIDPADIESAPLETAEQQAKGTSSLGAESAETNHASSSDKAGDDYQASGGAQALAERNAFQSTAEHIRPSVHSTPEPEQDDRFTSVEQNGQASGRPQRAQTPAEDIDNQAAPEPIQPTIRSTPEPEPEQDDQFASAEQTTNSQIDSHQVTLSPIQASLQPSDDQTAPESTRPSTRSTPEPEPEPEHEHEHDDQSTSVEQSADSQIESQQVTLYIVEAPPRDNDGQVAPESIRPSIHSAPESEPKPEPEPVSEQHNLFASLEQSTDSQIDSQPQQVTPSVVQASAQVNSYIVVSEDPDSSLDLLTQADYNPPPAGQRPPPSSLLTAQEHTAPSVNSQAEDLTRATQEHTTPLVNSSENPTQRTLASSDSTRSPFAFATQHPPRIEHERPKVVYSQHLPSSSPPRTSSQIPLVPSQSPRTSSQIPLVPSQSLVTIGDSAPAPLSTPSPFSIAANPTATMDPADNPLLAKLNAVTEARRARRKARQSNTSSVRPVPAVITVGTAPPPASAIPANVSAEVAQAEAVRHGDGARSPSTVPASEPEPVITKEDMRTSGRLPTLVPLVGASQSEDQSILTFSEARLADDPELAGVHIVPIPFGNIQRDQYKNGFHWYKGEIQGFLDGNDSPEQVAKAEMALEELRHIAMHPDLINSEAYSQPLSTPEQSQWDVDASCKFRFLRDLFDQLQHQSRLEDHDIHVVVAAKGHMIPATLSRFLQGLNMPSMRLSTILPAAQTQAQAQVQQPDIKISILDLDADVAVDRISRADVVVAMDGGYTHQDHLIQAARRAGRGNDDWATLLILVAPCTIEHIERSLSPTIPATTRLRALLNTALKLQLQEVAGRLTDEQSSSKEAALEIARFLASSSSMPWPIAELGIIDNLDSQTETDIDTSFGKRPLDIDMETLNGDSGKRPRVSPMTVNPQEMELTHISESFDFSSSEELRQLFSDKHDELQEHVKAMSDLQYRHEDQHVELAKAKKERDEAILTAQSAVARMTLAANQSATLRTERTELKQLLEEANKKLLTHEIPERREFETLRLAMEQEKLAKEKAEKRVDQEQKQSEYSREMYQNTSSRARELAQQNAELEARLVQAERLASGEQTKARQASSTRREKLLARENKKLKAMLLDREAGLKFRDEEIARLKDRGRISMRGCSPRMGSPALKGRNSRQASPSTGELKGKHLHPLRNG